MSQLKPRTASVVIYQGDDLATLSDLRQKAERASRTPDGTPKRRGDQRPGQAERDAYDAFVDAAAERAVVVELRAIGRRRFAALVAEHPPRKVPVETVGEDGETRTAQETHAADDAYGVNVETFGRALLLYEDDKDAAVRTITAPEFPRAALQDFIDDDVSEGDFNELWVTAYYLNRAPSDDPKSRRYSTDSPRSTES